MPGLTKLDEAKLGRVHNLNVKTVEERFLTQRREGAESQRVFFALVLGLRIKTSRLRVRTSLRALWKRLTCTRDSTD